MKIVYIINWIVLFSIISCVESKVKGMKISQVNHSVVKICDSKDSMKIYFDKSTLTIQKNFFNKVSAVNLNDIFKEGQKYNYSVVITDSGSFLEEITFNKKEVSLSNEVQFKREKNDVKNVNCK